jgi:hypothetical protein
VTEEWRERYDAQMAEAERRYADVLAALRGAEIPAEMTQTGGMCLAITFRYRDGYFLLTDWEDVLSWEPQPEDGWRLGLYDEEGDPIVLQDCYDEFGTLERAWKCPESAVEIAVEGIQRAAALSWAGTPADGASA